MTSSNEADNQGVPQVLPNSNTLCRICLTAAIVIAFGDKAVQFIY